MGIWQSNMRDHAKVSRVPTNFKRSYSLRGQSRGENGIAAQLSKEVMNNGQHFYQRR
jgi:hypothetical protein